MQFRSITARRARGLLFTVLVVLAAAPPAHAQEGPPPGGMRSGGRGPGFDPVLREGPPAPDSMAQFVQLDANTRQRYATLYDNLMADTRVERDSLAALRQARWAERAEGGGASRHRQMGEGAEIRQDLARRQQQFDKALEEFLSKDQMKRYHDWREARRKEARQRMRPPS